MKKKRLQIAVTVIMGAILLPMLAVYLDFRSGQYSGNDQPRMSGAMEALTFWTRSRAYPGKDISVDKHFKAYEKVKMQLKKAAVDDSEWKPFGPHNVPGRMIALAVNPQNGNTLYAGSASGGLWRTFSAATGGNWERVTTGFPTLGVMAIAIDPSDSNKMFIGTGEVYGFDQSIGGTAIRTTRGSYGIGILKTEDGGATWEPSLDWKYHQQRGVQCIRINPLNPKTVFAATTNGIYRSMDAGDTWQNVLDVLMGEDIIINPADTNLVMVSCGNLGSPGAGLYRSIDAGANWDAVTGIPSYTGKTLMDMYGSDSNIIFASVADSLNGIGLFRTNNFGVSWTQVYSCFTNADIPTYQGWFSHWVAVHPNDLSQVIYAGVPINKSNNSGISFQEIGGPHVDHHNYTHDPFSPNVIYIACDGGVYRSNNFGESYQYLGSGLQTGQFYNGFSSSSSDSNLAIGGFQDNGVNLYSGEIDGWTTVIGGDGCWTAINPLNDNIIYGEWQYNNLMKSENRGQSFASAATGLIDANVAFVAPFVISPSNPSILYSGRSRIYKTTNGASQWLATNRNVPLDGNPALSMAISATNPDVVYVGTAPVYAEPHLFRTEDGGDSWVNVTRFLPDRYPMDIAVDPNDDKIVYVVFGGFDSGHVFKTTNSGEYWMDITGTLPDIPTSSVAIDPLNSNHVYVGNDLAVYVSSDGGMTWENFSNGLPEAVMAMDLNISPSNRSLRVATHGNGVYQKPLVYKPEIYLLFSLDPFPSVVLEGAEIAFAAHVTNMGVGTLTEVSTAQVRVVDHSENEVFSDTKSFTNLGPKETQQIQFDANFVAQNLGIYTVQFIYIGAAPSSVADTIEQVVSVVTAPTITRSGVEKEYRAYFEISGGTVLPFGDDSYAQLYLPFVFSYDLWDYNKIQICSNGWCEFGVGQDGLERGLSTAQQIGTIGANENGRLAGTARPSKSLGPWWEDLNPEDSRNPGQVSYRTIGTAPHRILIIQWKNMRAYYDQSVTTRVNFQVRLYETSNVIEFHYGPVIRGTFGGGDAGAMIGFKDHIGGDYHFYDIAAGGMGLAGEIVTHLSPLTDWPGPDSCYVIQTITTDTALDDDSSLPTTIALYQNYPNPFNLSTTIHFDVPGTMRVTLKIYNTLGQEVKTLTDDVLHAGRKSLMWNGKDQTGGVVSSGVYLVQLRAGHETITRKMMVVK